MNRPRILAAVNAAAWLADRALTHLVPSAPRHVLEAENHRLRESLRDAEWTRRSLSADVDALTRIVSDLAEQLARATNHPSVANFDQHADEALATARLDDYDDLDAIETFQDFLYVIGEDL